MSKVVTVMNMKGGVGKTTTSFHLAGILSRYPANNNPRLKILAIDYDPQFNLSQAYLDSKTYFSLEKQRKTTISILLDDAVNLDPYKLQVPGNHTPPSVSTLSTRVFKGDEKSFYLDLIPSTLDMMYIALGQANTKVGPLEERFEKFIADCRSKYDLILIDCHPAGSLFTKTSLQNSDHVLIPVIPQKYAVRGIGLMMQFIQAKKVGTVAPEPIILFNSTSRTGVAPEEATIRADKRYAPLCMSATLKRYSAFSDPEEGKGFVWFSRKPYSTLAFANVLAVAREFKTRIGL